MSENVVLIIVGTLLAIIGYLINDKLSGIKDALINLGNKIEELNDLYVDHEKRISKLEDK